MSKNTQISELINYISVNGSGDIVMTGDIIMPGGSKAATQSYVTTAVSNLVASSPATLDTLNELATALGNDANFATTIATSIGTKQPQLSGTGFVKISGTTISYDNSTYLTTASASSTYQTIITNPVTGTGTTNTLPKFTGASTIGNSNLINDASGNLGLGVTPSAWWSGSKGLQIGASLPIVSLSQQNSGSTNLGSNMFEYAANAYKYVAAAFAGKYDINPNNGNHSWQTAPSGTAGNAISFTQAMTLNASGNLSIGNTNDTYKLDVNGTGRFSGALSGTSASFSGSIAANGVMSLGDDGTYGSNYKTLGLTGNTNGSSRIFAGPTNDFFYFAASTGSGFQFRPNASTSSSFTIASTGAATFSSSVTVVGNGRNVTINGGVDIKGDAGGWATQHGFSGSGGADLGGYGANGSGNSLTSYYIGTQGTPRIFINSSGNVGIGTTNPGYKLTVVSDSTAALLVQASSATVGSPIVDFYDNGRNQETIITSTDGTTTGTYIASYSNHPLMFGSSVGTSPTARMAIATDGRVGIGTTTPPEPLSVSFSAHGLISQHRQSNGIGVGQNFYMKFNNAAGSAVSYAGIYSDIQDNTTGAHTGRMILQVANAGNLLSAVTIASSGNVGISEVPNSLARLNVNGFTKINRSFYNWYQAGWQGNGTYWHMKTSMNAGLGGNVQYTMSLFKGYMYSYEGSVREGSIGFHNWDGVIYSPASSGNLFTTAYRSSDNFVVLVIPSGSGETGVTIDWHQAYAYPFVTAQVTAAGLHGATTGKY